MLETYILMKGMHLGFTKETFGRGSVLQFNTETRKLLIDGRSYDDYRDIDILKRQAMKKPHDPWIIKYSPEALAEVRGEFDEPEPVVPRRAPNNQGMKVITSDEDDHETIDISHTKIAQHNQAAKDARKQQIRDNGMEIIRGDETAEERIASLKAAKGTDMAARAERVKLMGTRSAKMPIVRDDSLGSMGGSKTAALNAGTTVGGVRAEDASDYVKTAAQMRKEEAEFRRKKVIEEAGLDPDNFNVDVMGVPIDTSDIEAALPDIDGIENEIPATPKVKVADSKDAELAALRAEMEALDNPPEPVVDPRDAEIAELRAQLAAKKEASTVQKVRKVPVTSEQAATQFEEA